MTNEKKPLKLKTSPAKDKKANTLSQHPWRLLIVDDEADVHSVTRLILAKTLFKDRPIELLSAYSAEQAEQILRTEKDIAVILLDVVMETDDAGLKLVHTIRHQLSNRAVRLILRTGQPGQAPEEQVIVDYDINDYKAKSELTAQKLFTTIIAALRSYDTIVSLEKIRIGLEKILNSSDSLFQIQSMREFASGVLTQLSLFLDCKPEGILCIEERLDNDFLKTPSCNSMKIIAATGKYDICLDCTLGRLNYRQFDFDSTQQ
jgi:CheY-like chemotaxis protein